jgi:hypothetical protein
MTRWRAAVGDEAAGERHAVHRRGHGMLAHAVMDVVAGEAAFADGHVVLGTRAVGARKIRRTADQLRQHRHQVIERQL